MCCINSCDIPNSSLHLLHLLWNSKLEAKLHEEGECSTPYFLKNYFANVIFKNVYTTSSKKEILFKHESGKAY